jgi:hypothetical protein
MVSTDLAAHVIICYNSMIVQLGAAAVSQHDRCLLCGTAAVLSWKVMMSFK